MFDALKAQPLDPLLALIGAFNADQTPGKMDLGVGVYKDRSGATPVMRAVKAAEQRLVETQTSKSYLGPVGNVAFLEGLASLTFGEAIAASAGQTVLQTALQTAMQTPGGTAALRLAFELVRRANPDATVWVQTPTWANHIPLIGDAGLKLERIPYLNPKDGTADIEGVVSALSLAKAGDVLLLHGCCHNPTGVDWTHDDWAALAKVCNSKGLIPLIDMAYQGFGDGLEADAAGLRHMVTAVERSIVTVSCSKNFGLYRERTGAIFALAASDREQQKIKGNLAQISRGMYSMPPDHGAAVVCEILGDGELRKDWLSELEEMRVRMVGLRQQLARQAPKLNALANGKGMFAMLPVQPKDVVRLRNEHGIYMPENGRINIAGLHPSQTEKLCALI